MMKTIVGAALLVMLNTGYAGAEQPPVGGRVLHVDSVNLTQQTVILDDQLYQLSTSTSVYMGGTPASPDALQVGEQVEVQASYSPRTSESTINTIWILSSQ